MKKNYEDLDIDFNNTDINLYIVFDKATGKDISGIIPASNDLVAVGSFVKFVSDQKEKMEPYSEYVLRYVGRFDILNLKIVDIVNIDDILSSKENLEEYYDGLVNYYNKINEE